MATKHSPRLLDQVRRALRTRHYSRRTEKAYISWVGRFVRFHGMRHPAELGEAEVAEFLSSLAEEGGVSPSTQNQAASAVLFMYRKVLHCDIGWVDGVVRAKSSRRLPVVLTREEVRAVMQHLQGTKRLVAVLLYGSGLRLFEFLGLRVKDIDLKCAEIRVRQGKGGRDRVTMLPTSAKAPLFRH